MLDKTALTKQDIKEAKMFLKQIPKATEKDLTVNDYRVGSLEVLSEAPQENKARVPRNKISLIQTEPYESNVAKTEVIPQLKPIEPIVKPKTHETANALSSVIVAIMWLLAVVLTAKGMM